MKSIAAKGQSEKSRNILPKPSNASTFDERANKIANMLLDGLKEGVKEEQERQKQMEVASGVLLTRGVTDDVSEWIEADQDYISVVQQVS